MKYAKLLFFLSLAILVVGCSQPAEKQALGAWKTEGNDLYFTLTETTFSERHLDPSPIKLLSKEKKVFIEFKDKDNATFVFEPIDKNTAMLTVPLAGAMKIIRTTEADIANLKKTHGEMFKRPKNTKTKSPSFNFK